MPRPAPGERAAPRDIQELRALAARHPDLATAAALHAELVTAVRRVSNRISTPVLDVPVELLRRRLVRGVPLASFGEFPIDWSEVRLLIRQITDVFRRLDIVDQAAAARLHAAGRDPDLPARVRAWYERPGQGTAAADDAEPDPLWPEVLQWAVKPFLIRVAEVLSRQVELEPWQRGACPVCAAEPDFASVASPGRHLLLCGRCHARWPSDAACVFCSHHEPAAVRRFTTPDRLYRVTRCARCGRYLKALDTQAAGRALLPFYDPVATLPLDAALMRE